MARTYYTKSTKKTVMHDPNFEHVSSAREDLQKRHSNWGAWCLTVGAVFVGAVGGSQFASWPSKANVDFARVNIEQIAPALGPIRDSSSSIQRAGDGRFYVDVTVSDVILTMEIDPTASDSVLTIHNKKSLATLVQTTGDVLTLPAIEFAGNRLESASFQTSEDAKSVSVIGHDLLSRIGEFEATPYEFRFIN